MNKENVELTKRLRDFFQIYLPKQKCYSENTVTSYKYAFNLFFDFLNSRKGIGMTKITMDCFSGESVSEFMEWLSRERNNSASTCNQRLMALRSFAKYNGTKDFSQFSLYAEMKSIPARKAGLKQLSF